jgi:hypothetical protein
MNTLPDPSFIGEVTGRFISNIRTYGCTILEAFNKSPLVIDKAERMTLSAEAQVEQPLEI